MCSKCVLNASPRIDPTKTSGIRQRFIADVNRRFAALKKDIATSIVDRDCFGINTGITGLSATSPKQFAFTLDSAKVQQFIAWLEQQERAGLLSIITRPGGNGSGPWSDIYIESAYMQGIRRADAEMNRAGFAFPGGNVNTVLAFNQPIHADRVAAAYMRTYEDLKTVLNVMNSDVRRTVADGLRSGIAQGISDGQSPLKIARNLMQDVTNRVDVIGVTRARMIARTETIRAHHSANMGEYRRVNEDMRVTVRAEFVSATDACPECSDLNGKIFSLDEAEGIIPVHPNCRCMFAPFVEQVSEAA